MPSHPRPLVLPFAGTHPALGAAPAPCGAGASLLGRVTAGAGLALGPFAVIRADGEPVTAGDGLCLGEGATVHIAQGLHATRIGDGVAVGRNSVVHACTVGDGCTIEDDVVVLDGSVVGDGVLIEAGSVVYPRSRLDAGCRYAGSPAAKVGPIAPDACRRRGAAVRDAAAAAALRGAPAGVWGSGGRDAHFIADTAVLRGEMRFEPGVGVFFGCRFDAGAVAVGRNTNVQDNCVIDAPGAEVVIGEGTTLGHNVRAGACRIGSRSLVGIGAVLAPGTVVEDDAFVAAGTATVPGQVLGAGWLWAGRPARPLRRLDAARRALMADTVAHYLSYGHGFREAQRRRAGGAG